MLQHVFKHPPAACHAPGFPGWRGAGGALACTGAGARDCSRASSLSCEAWYCRCSQPWKTVSADSPSWASCCCWALLALTCGVTGGGRVACMWGRRHPRRRRSCGGACGSAGVAAPRVRGRGTRLGLLGGPEVAAVEGGQQEQLERLDGRLAARLRRHAHPCARAHGCAPLMWRRRQRGRRHAAGAQTAALAVDCSHHRCWTARPAA